MTGHNVLVTGASTGIGRATALRLDRANFRVFACVRRLTDGDSLRAEASERLRLVTLDVTDTPSLEDAVQCVHEAVGDAGLQGLVNNAGIAVGAVLEYIDLNDLRRQFEVNVVGLVAVTRFFLPLIRRGSGRIINISSSAAYLAPAFSGPYTASKFAVEALSDSLRRELRTWDIPVSVIQPGAIETPIWNKGQNELERLAASFSAEGWERYGSAYEKMNRLIESTAQRAIPADAVAKAVERALTAARPRTRYRVGVDVHVIRGLTSLLPDRWVDAILARFFGLGV